MCRFLNQTPINFKAIKLIVLPFLCRYISHLATCVKSNMDNPSCPDRNLIPDDVDFDAMIPQDQ